MCSIATACRASCGEHLDGKQNRRLLIWSLLYLETFMKTFMTAAALASAAHV